MVLVSVSTNCVTYILIIHNKTPATVTQTQTVNVNAVDKKHKINLNTASLEELKALPGIGSNIAEQIVSNRPYKSIYDIVSIKGIGDNTIRNIEDKVAV